MERDRPGVQHRPAGVRLEEPHPLGGDLRRDRVLAAQRGGHLDERHGRQQEVHVARHRGQAAAGELVQQLKRPAWLAALQPQHGGLRSDRRHPLGRAVRGERGGLAEQRRGVPGPPRPRRGQAVRHRLQVRLGGRAAELGGPRDGQVRRRQVGGDHRVHGLPRRGEVRDPRRSRLLRQPVERTQLALHRHDVQALPGGRQPPQAGGQPRLGLDQVGGDLLKPRRQAEPLGETVRPPVGEQRRVQGVGHQPRVARARGEISGLAGEVARPFGITAVHPRPGERGREPAPARRFGRLRVRLVQQRGHLPRVRAEPLAQGQADSGAGDELGVAGLPRVQQRAHQRRLVAGAGAVRHDRIVTAGHVRSSVTACACLATSAWSQSPVQ